MRLVRLAAAAVVVAACGGGGDGGTTPTPQVASVQITPSGAQSRTVGGTVSFSAQPKDAQGGNLNRPVTWATSDESKVSLSATTGTSVTATAVDAGSAQITATSDTRPSTAITVTVTAAPCTAGANPCTGSVTATANDTFDPATVRVAPGGKVTWTFVPAPPHNVTFTGGNAPPGGTIRTTQSTTASRTFLTAGTYSYTCTLHAGMNGTVIVQ